MDEEEVPPSVDLLESMRSVGYTLEAAVADLIDNSLAANARSVEIDVDVVDGAYIAILDDGDGMWPDVAREALRLAGSVGERTGSDLGRFGLGLKTASLSQARSLTVVSRRGDTLTGLRWDIDHVRKSRAWSLLVLDQETMSALPLWEHLGARDHGTLVVWRDLDLLLGDTPAKGAFLAGRLEELRASLGLVFHRYLRGGKGGFGIRVNGIELSPTDPFLATNSRTQVTPTEIVSIGGAAVEVTAYTLPHSSGLSAQERGRPDLGEGMRDAQGFYVYRNRRLISHGHWYGLARMSEITKQTRIQVDVPSSLDGLWQLDIKKSRAEPPSSFKTHLRRLIAPVLVRGTRVHQYRGRKESPDETTHVWSKIKDRNGFRYEVNLENPAVEAVLARLASHDAERVESLLQTIADSYPFLDVYQEMASNSLPAPVPYVEDLMLARLREIRASGVLDGDSDSVAAVLQSVEPFKGVADLEGIVARVWEEQNDPE